jgi:hypothetical protein
VVDGKVFKLCSQPSTASFKDTYGRRWGWENSQTCVSFA